MAPRPCYIVTGGAGFVGANLAAELVRRVPNASVIVIDDFRTGSFANLIAAHHRKGLGPFEGEVIARPTVEVDFASLIEEHEPSAIFHVAAITDTTITDERHMLADNAGEDWASLLQECAQSEVPLVYASSAATYGTPTRGSERAAFLEESAGRPNNVYGFSKWLMECEHRRLDHARRQAGEPRAWIVGLRYFNVFGPGEAAKGKMASMIYQLTGQMLAGKRPRVFADGEQARDHVHVDDVVDCTLAGAGLGEQARVQPGIYNVGSGRATTFNELIDAIRAALGLPAEERPTKYFDMPDEIRKFYQDYTCADLTAVEAALGWRPSLDPLESVRRYALWLSETA
jgi:ADP-L-glycero-D-manno-heptose 6-epimerase